MRGQQEEAMAAPPRRRATSTLYRRRSTQLDGLKKWTESSNATISKDVDVIDTNFDATNKNLTDLNKNLEATKAWAKGELEKLVKAINAK
jgi:hypothetical protein